MGVSGHLGLISHSSVTSEENFLLALSLVSSLASSLASIALSLQYKARMSRDWKGSLLSQEKCDGLSF